jgi:hypothetical protein
MMQARKPITAKKIDQKCLKYSYCGGEIMDTKEEQSESPEGDRGMQFFCSLLTSTSRFSLSQDDRF